VIEIIVALTLLLSGQGYSQQEVNCAMNLVKAESNFHLHSRNTQSGAYGLFQLMNVKGQLSMKNQVIRFDRYIKSRYDGSICKALLHQKTKRWY
jgi:hypothetical protein